MVQQAEIGGLGTEAAAGGKRGVRGLSLCAVPLVLSAALLGACTDYLSRQPAPVTTARVEAPRAQAPVPKAKPTPPRQRAEAPPRKPAVPAETPDGTQTAALTPAAILPEAPRPPAVERFDPRGLVGLTEQETIRLLGQPTAIQENPPAKTWQYATGRCELRVHLFMEMTTRSFRTLSYEMNSTDEKTDVDQQCLAELVAQAWRPSQQ